MHHVMKWTGLLREFRTASDERARPRNVARDGADAQFMQYLRWRDSPVGVVYEIKLLVQSSSQYNKTLLNMKQGG